MTTVLLVTYYMVAFVKRWTNKQWKQQYWCIYLANDKPTTEWGIAQPRHQTVHVTDRRGEKRDFQKIIIYTYEIQHHAVTVSVVQRYENTRKSGLPPLPWTCPYQTRHRSALLTNTWSCALTSIPTSNNLLQLSLLSLALSLTTHTPLNHEIDVLTIKNVPSSTTTLMVFCTRMASRLTYGHRRLLPLMCQTYQLPSNHYSWDIYVHRTVQWHTAVWWTGIFISRVKTQSRLLLMLGCHGSWLQ